MISTAYFFSVSHRWKVRLESYPRSHAGRQGCCLAISFLRRLFGWRLSRQESTADSNVGFELRIIRSPQLQVHALLRATFHISSEAHGKWMTASIVQLIQRREKYKVMARSFTQTQMWLKQRKGYWYLRGQKERKGRKEEKDKMERLFKWDKRETKATFCMKNKHLKWDH